MFHVITVHWQRADWIDIQLRYLDQHLSAPYRVYAFLNGIDPAPYRDRFFYISTEPVKEHAVKLNLLADIACQTADDDDVLVFLDSDAFPIDDIAAFAERELPQHQFIAVRRAENLGDPQPHPCFAMTTVGFWKRLRGDWKAGFKWENSVGATVTDVGGNLMKQLADAGIEWLPLLRSNTVNPHPLFFAIYGDIVYHHGAGSRSGAGGRVNRAWIEKQPAPVRLFLRASGIYGRKLRETANENARLSDDMMQAIVTDPHFYRRLMSGS
jgi:hypothetical protein